MSISQYGLPLFVGALGTSASAQSLRRVRLNKAGMYDEAWLQRLIMQHPSLLPIDHIEPAFIPAIPICMELSVPSGFIDNLYATPTGDLIVGETKLFRNPESRREVIGQIIDYAKDLSAWSYAELDAAVRKAPAADPQEQAKGLYETVAAAVGPEGADEAQFVDAVSRNLKRGRFLLLVIGDGIQEGVEGLTRFLQDHAQLHFTFGLVELAIYEPPHADENFSGYLVQPRILARTFNIDRGTYSIEGQKVSFTAPSAQTDRPAAKKTTISEETFFEELETSQPGIGPKLRKFIARLEDIGVHTDFGTRSLILRWRPDDEKVWNLASITTSGKVWTEILNAQADQVGLLNLSHNYLDQIAASIPGATVKQGPKPTSWYVAKAGTYILIEDLIGHENDWFQSILDFTKAASDAFAKK